MSYICFNYDNNNDNIKFISLLSSNKNTSEIIATVNQVEKFIKPHYNLSDIKDYLLDVDSLKDFHIIENDYMKSPFFKLPFPKINFNLDDFEENIYEIFDINGLDIYIDYIFKDKKYLMIESLFSFNHTGCMFYKTKKLNLIENLDNFLDKNFHKFSETIYDTNNIEKYFELFSNQKLDSKFFDYCLSKKETYYIFK